MTSKLQKYFPMLRTREEVLEEIFAKEKLKDVFGSWEEVYQNEFLDFCTGVKGVKMLYDFCSKEVLNPEIYQERLNELLSLLLGVQVKIIKVLPNDNSRIADESSLLVMDIVVELEDGSIANVEIQKIGYAFPGQRSACYSADLLLRQYKAVRRQMTRDTFSYKEIKNVYTIVLFEKSSKEFRDFPDDYIHKFKQKSDTGLELDLLQRFVFVSLDIHKKRHQNKDIENKLDAWLVFLESDEPEDIIQLITKYPEFKAMYEQVYEICRNIEKVMGMFSEELRELDRNTVKYMMDEMQKDMDEMQREIDEKDKKLSEKDSDLDKKDKEIARLSSELDQAIKRIEALEKSR